jgi:hypothetical protein
MGSFIELNDTLQLTREQGFPSELDFEMHTRKPFSADQFAGRLFDFIKPDLRIYHAPPVRTFLVENIEGKWLYWGLCEIVEQKNDNLKRTTSGKFRITYLYTPEDMRRAEDLIDHRPEKYFFS